ncbi:MAG: PQQ-binding-like beta-propeller repeat protein [Myxococcota bacterium]
MLVSCGTPGPDDGNGDGRILWSLDNGEFSLSNPVLDDEGNIYLGAAHTNFEGGALYSIDSQTGDTQWMVELEEPITGGLAMSEDGVIYASDAPDLTAFDSDDGSRLWEFTADESSWTDPVIGPDGMIYVGAAEDLRADKIYAVDPSGADAPALEWEYEVEGGVSSAPVIGADGTLYFGGGNYVYALDSEQGSLEWRFETGDEVFSRAAIAEDGSVYIGSNDGRLYAFDAAEIDPENPSPTWSIEVGYRTPSSPVIAGDGSVYVGADDSNVQGGVAKVTTDGEPQIAWTFETSTYDFGPAGFAIGDDGTVYVGRTGVDEEAVFYALDGNTGEILWEFQTPGNANTAPLVGPDGTVYVSVGRDAFSEATFFALESDSTGLADSPWPVYGGDRLRSGAAR